ELDDLNDDFVALDKAGVPIKTVALDDFKQSDATAGAGAGTGTPGRYYWGGYPTSHIYFWPTHGWYRGPSRPAPSTPLPRVGPGASSAPAPRPTMFSSRTVGGGGGVGRQKPTGFGRVSYRAEGGSSGRSGSFGRAGSGFGGE